MHAASMPTVLNTTTIAVEELNEDALSLMLCMLLSLLLCSQLVCLLCMHAGMLSACAMVCLCGQLRKCVLHSSPLFLHRTTGPQLHTTFTD